MTDTKWYVYHQNNSGGRFTNDPDRGIGYEVIVEAENYVQANERAEAIGLYFDGSGDCSCCGRRWDRQDSFADEPNRSYGYDVLPSAPEPGTKSDWYSDIGSYAHPLTGEFYRCNCL
ncbi:MAG TPA: hypothetical protein VFT53_07450 [Candidatus Saccharimonadales bacterium]|nr:hypothetical protein [Candidatus Saccharimonadales bacterium]